MKSPSKTSAWLVLFMAIIWLVGCGEDDTEPPVATVSPAEGATVESGGTITVTFSEEVEPASVTTTVDGKAAAVTVSGPIAKITLPAFPSGAEVSLTVNAEDKAGNTMAPIIVKYKSKDIEPPTVTVSPVEGSTVKSGDVIVVTFSEEIIPASVVATISAGKAAVTASGTSATIALSDDHGRFLCFNCSIILVYMNSLKMNRQ